MKTWTLTVRSQSDYDVTEEVITKHAREMQKYFESICVGVEMALCSDEFFDGRKKCSL